MTEILTLFMIVQFFGILIATFSAAPVQVWNMGYSQGTVSSSPVVEAIYYIISIAIFSVLILAILRLYRNKGAFLFRLIEAFAVGFGTAAMFFIILATIFYNVDLTYTAIVSVILAAVIVLVKNKVRNLRNFAALTSSIGLGVIIGANGFNIAYLFMFVMAIYDYIAVFVTKHMLTLAKAASNANLSLLIGSSDIEVVPKAQADKKALAELKKEVKNKQIKDPMITKIVNSGEMPVLSQIQLGAGDLTLPLVMSIGLWLSTASYYLAIIAAIGAVFGLVATMWLLKRYGVALPAIPPLFSIMNFVIGIGMLVYPNPIDFYNGTFISGFMSVVGTYVQPSVGYYLLAWFMIAMGGIFMLLMITTLERNKHVQKKSSNSYARLAQKA